MDRYSYGVCGVRVVKVGETDIKTAPHTANEKDTTFTVERESASFGVRGLVGAREKRRSVKGVKFEHETPQNLEFISYVNSDELVDNADGTFTDSGNQGGKMAVFQVEIKPKGASDDSETVLLPRCFIEITEEIGYTEDGKAIMKLEIEATEDENGVIRQIGVPLTVA